MTNYTIQCETGHINLSPVAFHKSARGYFKCYLDFQKPGNFSSVPFFLCCRAIELALKAMHLESKTQKEVKDLYYHDLIKSYSALEPGQQILVPEELDLLAAANKIYITKEFEYLNVYDAVTAYKRFPDLDKLGALAKKITTYDA